MVGKRQNPLVFKDCENCGKTFEPRYDLREKIRFCCHPCFFAQFRIPVRDKFFSTGFEVLPSGCWHWSGKLTAGGYGYIPNGSRKKVIAHRASYEIHKGPIPKGLLVCHSCDNPPCVNPNHLWLGTDKDNSDDKISKGRANVPVGELASKAKLTERQVLKIRANRYLSDNDLAEEYGVWPATIWAIRTRKTWTHI
jgi:hypothetical protein